MAESTDWSGILNGLSNLYGAYRGSQTANDINSQVSSILGNTNSAYQQQLANLQQQIATGRGVSQGAYNEAADSVGLANQGLTGNINTLTGILNGLSDPNSVYMQNEENKMLRRDALAGRRDQMADRDVALQGTLANYIAQYSPSIQNAITNAQGQIANNNAGLAGIYNTMNMSSDRNNMSLSQLLQGMQGQAGAVNTTGRGAQNSATNNLTGLLTSGINAAPSLVSGASSLLGRLFSNDSGGQGITDVMGQSDPIWGYGGSTDYFPSYSYDWGSNLGGMGYDTSGLGSWAGGGGYDTSGLGAWANW